MRGSIKSILNSTTPSTETYIYQNPNRKTIYTNTRPFLSPPRAMAHCAFAFLAASLASFSRRAICASTPIPPNTRPTPSHCMWDRRWPKATTLRIMVNILRVTVTVTSRTDEKVESVWT